MNRIPQVVFSFLRVSREMAQEMGMVGCGLQLTDEGEYDWSATTCSLLLSNESSRCFISTLSSEQCRFFHDSGRARISLLLFDQYIRQYSSIYSFVRNYYDRRVIRLGPRVQVPPWELTPTEQSIIMMDDDLFCDRYISDPRISLKYSEVSRGLNLHKPVLKIPSTEIRTVEKPGLDLSRFPQVTKPSLVYYANEVLPQSPSPRGKSAFVAQRLRKDKRKLPSYLRTKNRVLELFYQAPPELRCVRIPSWYSVHMNAPSYAFRITGKSMSVKQRAVSTALRLYYMYRFVVSRRTRHCNLLIRISRLDSLFYLLYGALRSRRWDARISLAIRKLKVLLCPFWA